MSNSDIKRNTVFIQKKFQMRSIVTVVGIIAASGLLSGIMLYFLLSNELSSELQVAHQQIQNTWDSLAPAIIFGNIITVIVTGVVAAIAVLYQSHKIAGPMYRLQTICDEVSRGNYEPVSSLRKADQLTALANSFKEMLSALRDRKSNQLQMVADAQLMIDSLLKETDDENYKKLLNDLKAKIDSFN
ncbi:MAG: hypothetical protein DIZ80_14310 [endosymbiont of Galathealinum brachiosum]|uniref:HAMP domain-containing protein n=1 Tax=endosymbiont of Galathealinum brachiosum TaxID=2200906 RepID=A0A370D8P1_9GAMM|nr:MAG: hypothetical protein DIZ80_14310 [endosymbiont of Galathealinum brachiosum]